MVFVEVKLASQTYSQKRLVYDCSPSDRLDFVVGKLIQDCEGLNKNYRLLHEGSIVNDLINKKLSELSSCQVIRLVLINNTKSNIVEDALAIKQRSKLKQLHKNLNQITKVNSSVRQIECQQEGYSVTKEIVMKATGASQVACQVRDQNHKDKMNDLFAMLEDYVITQAAEQLRGDPRLPSILTAQTDVRSQHRLQHNLDPEMEWLLNPEQPGEEQLNSLIEMGFREAEARQALVQTGHNYDLAVDLLLRGDMS